MCRRAIPIRIRWINIAECDELLKKGSRFVCLQFGLTAVHPGVARNIFPTWDKFEIGLRFKRFH